MYDDERTQRIRDTAYLLWERAGRPEGGADEFWLEAERLLDEGRGPTGLSEEASSFTSGAEVERDSGGMPEPSDTSSVGRPARRRMTRTEP